MLVSMLVRRLLAVGLWLGFTASATAIVWAGTSSVASDLTDRPAPVVAHRDVVMALESGTPGPETTPGITAAGGDGPAPADPSDGPGSETSDPDTPESSGSEDPGLAAAPPLTPDAPPPVPPAVDPTGPPTTEPPSLPTGAYSTPGGVVTVRCTGFGNFFIDLVSATPNNGYAVKVVTAGPYYVEVHFVRPGQDAPFWAYCWGQPVRVYGGPPQQGQPPGSP